nr:hypothetical protein [Agrobacterium sp. rho-13.3]MDX8309256.1 hypothetical protein [Agrobacterium sp. rho-13.3]
MTNRIGDRGRLTIDSHDNRADHAIRVADANPGALAIRGDRVCRATLFFLPTDHVCPIDRDIRAAAHLVGNSHEERGGSHVRTCSPPSARMMLTGWMVALTAWR